MSSSATSETARIHLRLLDEDHTALVSVPTGPRSLPEVLPAARALTDQATGFILDKFRAAGTPSSCRAGCGACCRHLVAISLPEAVDLADYVAGLPPQRQAELRARFDAALRRLEQVGLLDADAPRGHRAMQAEEYADHKDTIRVLSGRYFKLHIACPFLENESCSVYERRPTVCREHHVLSPPEECSRPEKGEVVRVEVRLEMTPALARTTGQLLDEPRRTIPLVLALEWAEAHGERLRQTHDGIELFGRLVGQLDPQSSQPFAQRPDDATPGEGDVRGL